MDGHDATHYPLTFAAVPGRGLSLRIDYRTDLFTEHDARRLMRRFVRILEAVAARPDLPLGRVAVLDDDERALVLRDWQGPVTAREPGTLTGRFAEVLARRRTPSPSAPPGGRSPTPSWTRAPTASRTG